MRFHLCKDSGGKLEYFLNYLEKNREDATLTSSSARRIWNEISRVLLVSITVGPNGELDQPHITFTDLLLEREWHSASFCVRKPTTILLSVRGFLHGLSTTAHSWLYTLSSCAEEVMRSVPGTSFIASGDALHH